MKVNESYVLSEKKFRKHVYLIEKTSEYLFLVDFENKDTKYLSADYIIELDCSGKIENSRIKLSKRGLKKLSEIAI